MIVIAVRLDVLAVLYSIWLGLFLISSRRTIQRMWPVYVLFHIIAFPAQYLSVVGAPPFLCFGECRRILHSFLNASLEYPWTNVNINGWPQLKRWLYLADYQNPPVATQLIGKSSAH